MVGAIVSLRAALLLHLPDRCAIVPLRNPAASSLERGVVTSSLFVVVLFRVRFPVDLFTDTSLLLLVYVSRILVENPTESHTPVEIGDLRLLG